VATYDPATNAFQHRCKTIPIDDLELKRKLNDMSKDDMVVDPFSLITQASNDPPLIIASVEGGLESVVMLPPVSNISTPAMTFKQAVSKLGADPVLRATLVEMANMEKMEVFHYVNSKNLKRECLVMSSKIFYVVKTKDGVFDKIKARIVLRGDMQPIGSYGEVKSPTADKSSLFMLCALNKVIKGKLYSVDVPAAFLFAKLQEDIHMRLPKEITAILLDARPDLKKMVDTHGRITVKLLKSLYGLKQAPLNWYHHLVTVLEEADFIGCITDRCVFFRRDTHGVTHLLFHVDDLFISSNSAVHMTKLRASLHLAFGEMKWEADDFTFLGMHFHTKSDYSVDVDMVAYTNDIVSKHWTPAIGEEFKKTRGIINPSSDNLFHEVDHNPDATPEEVSSYKSWTMELLYATTVRIDILKECVIAASQSHAPGPRSWKLLRQLTAYLKETPSLIINFGAESTQLTLYADAGYALHPEAQSHTGIFVTLGSNGGPILVKSKRQSLITQSSTESELLALVDGVKRAIPLAKLLVELRLNNTVFIMVMQDNTSTISIARMGEGMHGKAKHFLVRFNFLRQMLDMGLIDIVHIGTDLMIADFVTKGMIGIKLQVQILRAMYHDDIEGFKMACKAAMLRVMNKKV
jgi:hypothetical protein